MINPLIAKGITLMLLSTIFFALMNAIIKYLNILGYSSMENVFFRAFFMVLSVWSLVAFAPVIRAILPRYKMPQIRAKKSGGFRHILISGVLLVANPSSSNIPPINALVGIIAAICKICVNLANLDTIKDLR